MRFTYGDKIRLRDGITDEELGVLEFDSEKYKKAVRENNITFLEYDHHNYNQYDCIVNVEGIGDWRTRSKCFIKALTGHHLTKIFK